MYIEVTSNHFHDAFLRMGRSEQFTYEGLEALFNHAKELEEYTGEHIELDVIALCCEFSEIEKKDVSEDENITIIAELDNGNVLILNE